MKPKLSKSYLQKHGFSIFLGMLMLFQLFTMFFLLKNTSIDNDDMCQLEVSISSPLSRILELLLDTDNNPPFFTLLAALWIRIVPYGSGWLKLLNQLFLVLATWLLGRTGYRYGSVLTGVITAVFSATSTILVYCCGDAFRPYGLLFLMGAVSLHAFLYRREHSCNRLSFIYYGLMIFFLAFTHYFGILTCFALFLCDVLLILRKKASPKVILCYVCAGICYLPWAIPVIEQKLTSAVSFWPTVPTFINIYNNCYSKYFDTSVNLLVMMIFLICIIFFYVRNHHAKQQNAAETVAKKQQQQKSSTIYGSFTFESLGVCLAVPLIVTAIDFIYSRYLNPAGSMWVERYFIVLYPYSFLLIGISWTYLYHLFTRGMQIKLPHLRKAAQTVFLVVLSLYLTMQGVQFVKTCSYLSSRIEQPFQQACEYLMKQEDFTDEHTAFLPTFTHEKKAYHYFFSQHDKLTVGDINWIPHPLTEDTALDQYDTVYLLEISTDLDLHTSELLQKNFTCVDTQEDLFLSKWIRK